MRRKITGLKTEEETAELSTGAHVVEVRMYMKTQRMLPYSL